MSQKRILVLLIMALVLCRCSTLENSLALGGGIGAVAGVGAGAIGNYDDRSIATIAVMCGVGGALIAYLAYETSQKKKKEPSPQAAPPKNQTDKDTPTLSAPKVRRIWVPDKIEGDKFIKGHWLYKIDKNSQWTR